LPAPGKGHALVAGFVEHVMSDMALRLVCVLFAAALVAFASSSLGGGSPPEPTEYAVTAPGQ